MSFETVAEQNKALATQLGEMQSGVLAALPSSPNERLVYECEVVGE